MNILVVLGTRPEAVKMAPVIRALRGHPARPSVELCLTAQHRDLLDQALALFDLPVDYDLNLMRPDQSLSGLTGAVLAGLEPILVSERPDLVLVHVNNEPVNAAFWTQGETVYAVNDAARTMNRALADAPDAITEERVRSVVH